MKIQLSPTERKHLYALLKLLATKEENKQVAMLWLDLARDLQPNQLIAEMRREKVKLLLALVTTAIDNVNKGLRQKLDVGQSVRADMLERIMVGVKEKLEKKLDGTILEQSPKDS